ncbi:hypothetical protein R2A130_2437 [Ahrensia sp. R2A130]|nr:hypothetical protein R2A130_2437 [Ahrensia sp. R2A130]
MHRESYVMKNPVLSATAAFTFGATIATAVFMAVPALASF